MRKGRPFLEILSSSLHGDYKFPILEVLAFLFLVSSFVFVSFGGFTSPGTSEKYVVFNMARSLMGLPLFILVMLLLRNIASGIGSDLEKGTIQTILAYPLKRRWVLGAKLLSAIVVGVVLFLMIQFFALFILAPDMVLLNLSTVFVTYAANISSALFVAGLTLLLTLILRKGSVAIVAGIMFYFLLSVLASLVSYVSLAINSTLIWQVFSLFSPSSALDYYYGSLNLYSHVFWTPNFSEVLLYIGTSYGITAFLFFLSGFYFCRRLNL